jgi:CubicO group peptidase (beta-lactamase class C family)
MLKNILAINLVLVSGLAVGSGLAVESAATQTQTTTQTTVLPRVDPESVGLSSAAVKAVAARARALIEDGSAVGSELLIIKNRKVVLHEAYGWKDAEDALPMQPDTICCIRSMTKPLVGTAIQILIDEGKLGLDDRAGKYLPSFDNDKSREITIDQLLTHTSGLPLTAIDKPLTAYSGEREAADQAGKVGPTIAKPGVRFSYSDADSYTLAEIVSVVSGQPVEQFIQKRILDPLGMKDTYCVLGKDSPPRSRVSSNYAGSTALWHKYWDRNAPVFFPFFLGSASAYSTTSDYARFLAMFMDHGMAGQRRLLSEAAVQRVLTPRLPMLALDSEAAFPTRLPGHRVFYGEHMMIYDDGKPRPKGVLPVFGHGGADGTFAWAFPAQDLMVLYFTQARGGLSGLDIESTLGPLAGLPAGSQEHERVPLESVRKYCGCYTFGSDPDLFVVTQGKRLAIIFPQLGLAVLGWPDKQGKWDIEGSARASQLTFVDDPAGGAHSIKFFEDGKELTAARITRPKDMPSADQLLDFIHLKQGGKNVDAVRSMKLTGTLQVARLAPGAVSTIAVGTDQFRQEVALAGGKQTVIINRGHGWRQTDVSVPFESLGGLLYEEYLLRTPLSRLFDWRRYSKSVQVLGQARIENEDSWVVSVARDLLPPTIRYVSVKRGLVIKEEGWITISGVGTVARTNKYEDYRDVEGVLIPFRVIVDSPATGHQVVQYTEAKINADIPGEVFSIGQR